jgi:hypothetical protein
LRASDADTLFPQTPSGCVQLSKIPSARSAASATKDLGDVCDDSCRPDLVGQVLHEYATALTAARANRSRRCLIKCAKDSGHTDAADDADLLTQTPVFRGAPPVAITSIEAQHSAAGSGSGSPAQPRPAHLNCTSLNVLQAAASATAAINASTQATNSQSFRAWSRVREEHRVPHRSLPRSKAPASRDPSSATALPRTTPFWCQLSRPRRAIAQIPPANSRRAIAQIPPADQHTPPARRLLRRNINSLSLYSVISPTITPR